VRPTGYGRLTAQIARPAVAPVSRLIESGPVGAGEGPAAFGGPVTVDVGLVVAAASETASPVAGVR